MNVDTQEAKLNKPIRNSITNGKSRTDTAARGTQSLEKNKKTEKNDAKSKNEEHEKQENKETMWEAIEKNMEYIN